jgi:salicylate hydroxylase
MKIVIVGAGLAGLTAALRFAQQGHEVRFLEQRNTLSPQGSRINIRPGASRILHSGGFARTWKRSRLKRLQSCSGALTQVTLR